MTRTEKWKYKRELIKEEAKLIKRIFILDEKEKIFKETAEKNITNRLNNYSVTWDGTK